MTQQKNVLFFSLYSTPNWLFHHQVDATVATALKMRGADVLITGCDGLFTSCYILRGATGETKKELCQLCSQTSKAYYDDFFKLPHIQLRDFVVDDDYNLAKQWVETVDPETYVEASYQNLEIGQWVTSSIYTYFRITAKGLCRPDVRQVHKQYLIDGLVTCKAVFRLIDFYQPTHLFLLGARLAPSRIAFEIARQRNIDIIVQERGFINNSYTLVDNHTCMDTKPPLDVVRAWENIPLNNSELSQVKKYWLERETGQNLNIPSFYDYQTDYSSVNRQLNIPEDAKIFAVFTSSEDEFSMTKNYAKMTKQLEIIERLMEIFADRDEYLVIRHHPNIGGSKYTSAQIDFIVEAYQQSLSTPENVRIIMPSEQLTSYALLWHTDAAISFFSTMAIECAAKGIPTAALENSLYHPALKYVLHEPDVASLRTLVDSLLSNSAKPTIEDLRKVYRFTNAYFFKFCHQFRSFNVQGLNFDSNDDLKPGIDSTLDKVCNRILYGSSLYNLPTIEDEQRSAREETNFLDKYLLEITDFRQKVRQETLTKNNQTIAYPSVGIIKLNYQHESETRDYLSESIKRSRYQKINEYSVDFDLEDHCKGLESILALLEDIPENYILLTHSNIQYNESIIFSAMEILLADVEMKIPGIWFGGWLPANHKMMENGRFIPQGIFNQHVFNQHDSNLSYEQTINTLPWLKYPPSLLAFSLMRKKALVKVLDMSRHLPTREQVAELLFIFLQGTGIRKIEKSMLFIHEIPEPVQQLFQKYQANVLADQLGLRDINLIMFPDWHQSEESLYEDFANVLKTMSANPDKTRMTLLIDTDGIDGEDANLFFSGVAMNLLMEEAVDIADELEVSLLDDLTKNEWELLLSLLQGRISLDNENQNAIAKAKAESLKVYS